MKQQFLKDKTDTISLTVYQDNRALIPTSATITLYTPSGSELQASDTATVDGTTGEITYALTAAHTASLGLNYKASFSYVVAGITYHEDILFDVVLSILNIPITDEDLFNELDSLRDNAIQITGTATAATSSTLVDTSELKQPDDYWTGGAIEIIAGTGVEQIRDISDFVQSSSTVTVSPDWATDPDTTSVYRIIRSYTTKIDQAFEKLKTMIYNKGKRHSLIIESSQIKVPMIYLTVHFICLDSMTEDGDKWSVLANRYWELFKDSFGNMTLDYDADESGYISDEEEQRNISSVELFRR